MRVEGGRIEEMQCTSGAPSISGRHLHAILTFAPHPPSPLLHVHNRLPAMLIFFYPIIIINHVNMLLLLLPNPSVIAVVVVSWATNVSSSFATETQLRNQNAQC